MAGDTEVTTNSTATDSTSDAAAVDTSKKEAPAAGMSRAGESFFDNLRNAPLAPRADLHPDYSDQAFQSGAVSSARVQGAKAGLSAPGPSSSTNAAPQPFTGRPGSLGWQLAQVAPLLPSLAKRYGAGTALLMGSTTAIGGVSRGPEGEENLETPPPVTSAAPSLLGGTDLTTAGLNADQTRPTTPVRQGPDRAQAASGIVDRLFAPFAGQAGALGGAGKVAEANIKISKEDQLATANANAQMIHEQLLSHKMGEEGLQASLASGKAGLAAVQSGHIPGQVLAMEKTSDDINKMLKSGQFNLSTDTAFLTGRNPVGVDSNGAPMYRSTYTIVRLSPTPVELSEDEADYLNDNIPGQKLQGRVVDKNGKVTQKGQEITPAQLNWMWQQASNAERANAMRDAELDTWKLKKENLESDLEAKKLAGKPFMTDLLARNKATYFGKDGTMHYDPFGLMKAYLEGLADPAAKEQTGGKFQELFPRWLGQKNFDTIMGYYLKLAEKNETEAHTITTDRGKAAKDPDSAIPAANAILRQIGAMPGQTDGARNLAQAVLANPKANADDKAKAQSVIDATQEDYNNAQETLKTAKEAQQIKITQAVTKVGAEAREKQKIEEGGTGGSDLTGQAFLNQLPAARRNEVMGYINGLSEFTATMGRTKQGEALLRDIRAVDADWDASKAPAYFKARQDFTTGKAAIGINAANTVVHHLNRMYDNLGTATAGWTGSVEQAFGGNKAGRQVADDAIAVSNELGKLYSGGVVTESEAKDWAKKLDPNNLGMTAGKLRTNVAEFCRLLGGKLEAYQDQWDDSVPSPNIPAAKKIASEESVSTYKKLTGEDMKVHDVQPGQWDNETSIRGREKAHATAASTAPVTAPAQPSVPAKPSITITPDQLPKEVPKDAQMVYHDPKQPNVILGYKDKDGKIHKF